jgi:hypothetical protein
METGLKRTLNGKAIAVLLQANCNFLSPIFSPFRASANPSFPIEKHVKKSKQKYLPVFLSQILRFCRLQHLTPTGECYNNSQTGFPSTTSRFCGSGQGSPKASNTPSSVSPATTCPSLSKPSLYRKRKPFVIA